MIRFRCPSCGASFDVDDRFAGRVGRCKSCGARTTIPTAVRFPQAQSRADGEMPKGIGLRLTPLDAEPVAERVAPRPVGRPTNWLEAVNSQVALAPISVEGLKGVRPSSSPLDEPSVAGPYNLVSAPSLPALEAASGRPAGALTRGYRHGMGRIQKVFRWINQSAYLVSVPFIMLVLLGLIVDNHSLLTIGATVVVLLNIGRIVAGLGNLLVIPFRQSPVQGLLFLIPPFTFFYLAQNWDRVHQPVKRILGPIFTILLVAAAFIAEPWMRGKEAEKGTKQARVQEGFRSASSAVQQTTGNLPALNLEQVGRLKQQAIETLKSMKSQDNVMP